MKDFSVRRGSWWKWTAKSAFGFLRQLLLPKEEQNATFATSTTVPIPAREDNDSATDLQSVTARTTVAGSKK